MVLTCRTDDDVLFGEFGDVGGIEDGLLELVEVGALLGGNPQEIGGLRLEVGGLRFEVGGFLRPDGSKRARLERRLGGGLDVDFVLNDNQ